MTSRHAATRRERAPEGVTQSCGAAVSDRPQHQALYSWITTPGLPRSLYVPAAGNPTGGYLRETT